MSTDVAHPFKPYSFEDPDTDKELASRRCFGCRRGGVLTKEHLRLLGRWIVLNERGTR
jgi:hypothetical protein